VPGTARPAIDRLEIADVSRHFGRRRALSHVTLTAGAGEIIGLLGPNGAGKSTLLTILATLLTPSSGTVRYGGRTAAELGAPLRGRLGFLAHDLHLYPELSARENLDFFARLYGVEEPRTRVASALAGAQLDARADEAVAGFSRGMRQRLALERALLHDPDLVLLDEPFTGLDDESSGRLKDRLRDLRASGAIVILATHDLDLVADLLDRAAIFREGRLISDEPCSSGLRLDYRARVNHQ
jgi:heme ABC exporter ATP-binding subunit CcmA